MGYGLWLCVIDYEFVLWVTSLCLGLSVRVQIVVWFTKCDLNNYRVLFVLMYIGSGENRFDPNFYPFMSGKGVISTTLSTLNFVHYDIGYNVLILDLIFYGWKRCIPYFFS